jgi:16S rRNA processing protein RimM
MGALEWRGQKGGTRMLEPKLARAAAGRLLVTFAGLATREDAVPFVNGTLWAERARLPDPGPGVSYAFQLTGMRVVDQTGATLGTVADVIFNAGQPLLQLEGEAGRLIPCQPPFMKHVDADAGVITLELPPGLDEV